MKCLFRYNDRQRFEENLQIECEGPVFDIEYVEPNLVFKTVAVPSVHLGHSGDSRLQRKHALLRFLVFPNLFGKMRPGSNEAHIALKHVEKLRKFVDIEPSDEFSNLRDSRVVFDFEEGSIRAFVLF